MRAVDLRNATWAQVLTHLTEDLVRVHLALQAHGPCTTRQLAVRSGISLLTVRPRITDLGKLGLVTLVGQAGSEGVYAYVPREQAAAAGHWRTEADFRRALEPEAAGLQVVGFKTVDEAIASLTHADRAALGARLMAQYGHHSKRRDHTDTTQLTLGVA